LRVSRSFVPSRRDKGPTGCSGPVSCAKKGNLLLRPSAATVPLLVIVSAGSPPPLTTLTTSGDIEGAASFLFMDTDYYLFHRVLRRIASWGAYSFFTEVRVIGGENVPANGPIIVYVYLLDP